MRGPWEGAGATLEDARRPPVRARARIKDGKKGAERSHLSTKQPVVGCFALWPIFANRSDPRQQSSNDTPAQPQSQAMGAAQRDPRRGESPVTCASTVPDCRPNTWGSSVKYR